MERQSNGVFSQAYVVYKWKVTDYSTSAKLYKILSNKQREACDQPDTRKEPVAT
jgi:hypothetical protein